jgi:hypothetical protein
MPLGKINPYIPSRPPSGSMPHDEKSPVELVAGLMALSARTAPKGKGQDALVTRVLVVVSASSCHPRIGI